MDSRGGTTDFKMYEDEMRNCSRRHQTSCFHQTRMDRKHLPDKDHLRIVLLGKTGVGKSSAGNIILGHEVFLADVSPSSATTRCQKAIREFNGQTLAIVDTPGLFHTDRGLREVMTEISGCITWISPGPHVFLLVLRLGTFSRQDQKCLETFQKVFKDAKRYTIVLFTHGDQSEQGCDAFIKQHKDLKRFLEESCEAHHVFNNRVEDESQVNGLLQKINHTVQNNRGSYYSNELIREIEPVFKEVRQLPEVTSAHDPVQAATEYLEGWICKGLDTVVKKVPGLGDFLKKVEGVALKCMPPEAFQSQ